MPNANAQANEDKYERITFRFFLCLIVLKNSKNYLLVKIFAFCFICIFFRKLNETPVFSSIEIKNPICFDKY
jgi:hypothetical protein